MVKVSLDIWLLAICIALPSLCLFMTICIYFKKGRQIAGESNLQNPKQKKHKFEDEIVFHVACQEVDDLLKSTIDNIEKQRQFIKKYIDKQYKYKFDELQSEDDQKNIVREISSEKKDFNKISRYHENEIDVQVDSDYRRIDDLFQSGMTSKQISERTKIPQSEIDLYIKLHLKKSSVKNSPVSLLRLSV